MVWIGVGIRCEFLRHRMRHHRLVVRWLAAIPIASIVTGTLLYGTDYLSLKIPL